MSRRYKDRTEAGQVLAERLSSYAGRPGLLVLALPRGGVPVAYEVARGLNAPLDVFVVRKLGVPGHEELALGAIASGGVQVFNRSVVDALGISQDIVDRVVEKERNELQRREKAYRGDRPPISATGCTVILIDDGLATGATMRAAVLALKKQRPAAVVVAVPTAAQETCDELRTEVDEVICAVMPEPFHAVGLWYEDFGQTTDEEVRDLLDRAWRNSPANMTR